MYYAFIYISNLFQDKFWTYWPAEILRQHPGLRETTEGALRDGGNKDELKPPPGRTLLPECCPKATKGSRSQAIPLRRSSRSYPLWMCTEPCHFSSDILCHHHLPN